MRISVKDAETGSKITMDVEGDNTIEEIKKFWKVPQTTGIRHLGHMLCDLEKKFWEESVQ